MFNPMNNSQEESNSIDFLNYLWEAHFTDGTIICQLEETGIRLFKDVQEKLDKLEYFCLYNRYNLKEKYIVDIKAGLLRTAYSIEHPTLIKERNNIRLIYKRTSRGEIGNGITKYTSIKYLLGLQYLDNQGFNQKILMCIDNLGNILIGD